MLRDKDEIEEQIGKAMDVQAAIEEGQHQGLFGQTYEDGVKAALEWALGDIADPPIDPDDYDGVEFNC